MGPAREDEPFEETGAPEEAVEPARQWLDLALIASNQLPWWAVSVALHALSVLLISLLSMSIGATPPEEMIVQTTVIEKPPLVITDEPPPQGEHPSGVPFPVRGTDPNATESMPVVLPDGVREMCALGEQFITNNPDRRDTQSAFGNLDARLFLADSGCDELPGGGGGGGLGLDSELLGAGTGGCTGTGTGWYGGDGSGLGPDKGPGRGTFGRPDGGGRTKMVGRFCDPPLVGRYQPELRVTNALLWLARHQDPDGHWDTRKYESQQQTDTACTGLALLAFLGAGHTERVGNHKETVRKGVAWLKSKQNAEGLVFDSTDAGGHRGVGYPHAIAAMALAEAAGMAGKMRAPDTFAAAQKAVDYAVKVHQRGDYDKLGWRYKPQDAGDLSVTGWYVMLLKSAKIAGLNVPTESFLGALKFLDRVEKKGQGGDKGYGAASVFWYQPENEHGETAHRLTAIGTLARQFLGAQPAETEANVAWYVEKGGLPDGWSAEKTDLYYWYYGTMSTFLQQGDSWKKWNAAMLRTLGDNQRKDGDEKGSWDPIGAFAGEWGRVGQTALACLCLEVYYRYPCYMKK
jgi:hypothetical protein